MASKKEREVKHCSVAGRDWKFSDKWLVQKVNLSFSMNIQKC